MIRTYRHRPFRPASQRGSALFTALVMLIALTIISLASLGTSLLELRMSNNTEAGVSAFQAAQSAIDNTIYNSGANFIVTGSINHTNCTAGRACDMNDITLPAPFSSATSVEVRRTSDSGCPPRMSGYETSCAWSKAASFNINSQFDRSTLGQGQAELNQGYIKLYPTTPGTTGNDPTEALHN